MKILIYILLLGLACCVDARRKKQRGREETPASESDTASGDSDESATNVASLRYNYYNGAESYRGPDSYSAADSTAASQGGGNDNAGELGGLVGLGQLAASIRNAFQKETASGGSPSTSNIIMSSSGAPHPGITSVSYGSYQSGSSSGSSGATNGGSSSGYGAPSVGNSPISGSYSGHGGPSAGGVTVVDGPGSYSQHGNQGGGGSFIHQQSANVGSQSTTSYASHGGTNINGAGGGYKSYQTNTVGVPSYVHPQSGGVGLGSLSNYPIHALAGYSGPHSGVSSVGQGGVSVSAGYKVGSHGNSESSNFGSHSNAVVPGTIYGSSTGLSYGSGLQGSGGNHGYYSNSVVSVQSGPGSSGSGGKVVGGDSPVHKGALRPSQVDYGHLSNGIGVATTGGIGPLRGLSSASFYGKLSASSGLPAAGSHGGTAVYGVPPNGGVGGGSTGTLPVKTGHPPHGVPVLVGHPTYLVSGVHAAHQPSFVGHHGGVGVSHVAAPYGTYDLPHLYGTYGAGIPYGSLYGVHHVTGGYGGLLAGSSQVTKQVVKVVKVPRPVPVAIPRPVAVAIPQLVSVPYKPHAVTAPALKALPVDFEKPYSVAIVKRVPHSVPKTQLITLVKRTSPSNHH